LCSCEDDLCVDHERSVHEHSHFNVLHSVSNSVSNSVPNSVPDGVPSGTVPNNLSDNDILCRDHLSAGMSGMSDSAATLRAYGPAATLRALPHAVGVRTTINRAGNNGQNFWVSNGIG